MLEFKVRDLISKRDRVCRDATLALEWVKCNPHLSKAAYNKKKSEFEAQMKNTGQDTG